MTEDEIIKVLCQIRDKYCQWGEVAVMDKAIRLIQDQQNKIRLLKEMQNRHNTSRFGGEYKVNCDDCKHYHWYYDYCDKWGCEMDARACNSCFESRENAENGCVEGGETG